MSKKKQVQLCGAKVKVQAYGGGVRWACPVCDRGYMGTLPSISWVNGDPPADRTCKRPRKDGRGLQSCGGGA